MRCERLRQRGETVEKLREGRGEGKVTIIVTAPGQVDGGPGLRGLPAAAAGLAAARPGARARARDVAELGARPLQQLPHRVEPAARARRERGVGQQRAGVGLLLGWARDIEHLLRPQQSQGRW